MKNKMLIMLLVALFLAASIAAQAQILPTDPLREIEQGVLDPIEQQIEDQIDAALEDGDLIGPGALVDRLDEILPPDPVWMSAGLTQGALESLQLSRSIAAIDNLVTGAVSELSTPLRPIQIDETGAWPVLLDEWVVLVDVSESGQIEALQVDVLERTLLQSSDLALFTIRVRSDSADALRATELLEQLGADRVDRNYVYRGAQGASQPGSGFPAPNAAPGGSSLRLGLIDTAIDLGHPSLSGLAVGMEDFVTLDGTRPLGHGTAVASILARHVERDAQLLAASVFFLSETGQTGASTASLVKAMDWMLANDVPVINFSLTGPPDRILERMIALCQAQGTTIVAAVGNGGPASPPLYPAAYDGVIGVTAVDASGTLYRWANRGPYVDIAAIGVGVDVARPGGSFVLDSGTSFAAPVVAAHLARSGQPRPSVASLLTRVAQPASASDPQLYGAGIFTPE